MNCLPDLYDLRTFRFEFPRSFCKQDLSPPELCAFFSPSFGRPARHPSGGPRRVAPAFSIKGSRLQAATSNKPRRWASAPEAIPILIRGRCSCPPSPCAIPSLSRSAGRATDLPVNPTLSSSPFACGSLPAAPHPESGLLLQSLGPEH